MTRTDGPALSYHAWLSHHIYISDITILVLEWLTTSAFYLVETIAARMCVPVAGVPYAALQGLLLSPDKDHADAIIASFPCQASFIGRLTYVFRTFAFTDPRVRLKAFDYGSLLYLFMQLLCLFVATFLPTLYVNRGWRHWLVSAAHLAPQLGVRATLALAPAAAVAVGSPAYYGTGRRRSMFTYRAIRMMVLLKVPASFQLLLGPAVWLVAASARPLVDARVPPPPGARPLGPVDELLAFLVMAVLPYLVTREWERRSLLPQYRAYLRDKARRSGGRSGASGPAPPAAAAATAASDAAQAGAALVQNVAAAPDSKPIADRGAFQGNSRSTSSTLQQQPADIASVPQPRQRPTPTHKAALLDYLLSSPALGIEGSAQSPQADPAMAPVSAPSALYRSPLSGSAGGTGPCVQTISLKVYIPHGDQGGPPFAQVASRLSALAAEALEAACDVGGMRHRSAPVTVLLSAAVAEGCAHLLMMLRSYGSGNGPISGGVQTADANPVSGSGGGGVLDAAGRTNERHTELSVNSLDGVDADAVRSAVSESHQISARQQAAVLRHADDAAGVTAPDTAAFAWPPAMSLAYTGVRDDRRHGRVSESPALSVMVFVPSRLLRGLARLWCVVAGPTGRVHADAEAEVGEQGRSQEEEETGTVDAIGDDMGRFHALRLQLPAAACGATGVLAVHLLPPRRAREGTSVGDAENAAAAGRLPSAAPLASLPLLVLPADAAAEVRRLYGEAVDEMTAGGEGAEGRVSLAQLDSLLAGVGAAEPAACVSPAPPAALPACAAASAAFRASMADLAFDMAALMRQPGAVPPAVTDHLLAFLAGRGMAACVRECNATLTAAGLCMPGAADFMVWDAADGRSASAPDQESWTRASSLAESSTVGPASSGLSHEPSTLSAASSEAVSQPHRRASHGGWLRIMLLGFSPPALETAYQDFMARRLYAYDRCALAAVVVARALLLLKAIADARGQTVCGFFLGGNGTCCAQLRTLWIYLLESVAVLVVALTRPRWSGRLRTSALLLNGVLEAALLGAAMWPPYSPSEAAAGVAQRRLLAAPAVLLLFARSSGVQYLYRCVWMPLSLQLSLRHQATLLAAFGVPFYWAGLRSYLARTPAACFVAAYVVSNVVLSGAMDAWSRRSFLRQHGGAAAKPGGAVVGSGGQRNRSGKRGIGGR